jgi:hypothetical protein
MRLSPVEIERFWDKVDFGDWLDCWHWKANTLPTGYGRIGTNDYAHRVAYELLVGPIPDGLTIDHLCRNTSCVNPLHLEAVTLRENILRGTSPAAQQAKRTHCPQGHPLDDENTYTWRGHRRCKACNREACRRAYAKRRATR